MNTLLSDNSWVGPAVVAACVSGVVAIVGFIVSTWTARSLHTARLETDRMLAERKIESDVALADRKLTADLALAEKRVALDRAFAGWKRRAEFAEEVLTDFYQAGDVINAARSPGSFEGEGDTRQKGAWETEQDTRTLNAYFATTERLVDKREFFAQLHARRYRFVAYFGSDDARAYDDLHKIYAEIVVSVRMLVQTHQERNFGTLPQNRREWQAVIWDKGDDDPIRARLDRVIERIEATRGPAIREMAQ